LFASLPTALAADGLDDFIGAKLARRRIPGSQPFTAMAIMTLVTDDERLADLRSYTE